MTDDVLEPADLQDEDSATEAHSLHQESLVVHYYVVYSQTYRVPALYFEIIDSCECPWMRFDT